MNFIGIGIILLIIGVITFLGCTQEPKVNDTILIQNSTFNLDTMQVRAVAPVMRVNQDNSLHKIVSDTGAFESPTLNHGDTFNYTFSNVGKYNYHDGIKTSMKGKIIVQNKTT